MVFVDNYNKKFGRMIMCHIIADTDEELYTMIDKISVKRKWKHNDHFNICINKKRLAIENGAVEILTLELAKIWYLKKMRKKRKIKNVLLSEDLKNIRENPNYFEEEKQRIRKKENE